MNPPSPLPIYGRQLPACRGRPACSFTSSTGLICRSRKLRRSPASRPGRRGPAFTELSGVFDSNLIPARRTQHETLSAIRDPPRRPDRLRSAESGPCGTRPPSDPKQLTQACFASRSRSTADRRRRPGGLCHRGCDSWRSRIPWRAGPAGRVTIRRRRAASTRRQLLDRRCAVRIGRHCLDHRPALRAQRADGPDEHDRRREDLARAVPDPGRVRHRVIPLLECKGRRAGRKHPLDTAAFQGPRGSRIVQHDRSHVQDTGRRGTLAARRSADRLGRDRRHQLLPY